MIVFYTNAKIVVTSAWRYLKNYPLIEDALIRLGLPIFDKTLFLESRGAEIKNYIETHSVQSYIILDDEIFPDFDDELLSHLIKTDFYNEGLTYEIAMEVIELLNYQNKKSR